MNLTQAETLVLWEITSDEMAACHIGVAGDFLPAMALAVPEGYTWRDMAKGIAKHFQDVAVSFINLESPVNVLGLQPKPKMGLGENLSAPEEALDYLLAIRANVVGLANNHIYDYGREGLVRTKQAVLSRGMTPLGSGRRLIDAPEVFVWDGPGQVRVGFWTAANITSEPATVEAEGVEVATTDRALQALQEMKDRGANCCIALLHAGLEGTNYPDPEDVRLIGSLAKLGFNVVAACHSHRISGHAVVTQERTGQTAFCFYGLGSLSSGCIYSSLEREGLVIVVGLNSQGAIVRVEIRPVFLAENGWGTLPTPQTTEVILRRFSHVSVEIADGSYQRLFYKDMSKGLIGIQLRDAMVAYRQAGIRGIAQKLSRLRMRHVRRLVHKVLG